MYKLYLQTHFSAAHQLTNAYDSKCNNSLHGHNWKVEIKIWTEELKNGMVVDFTKLKEIINQLDHKNLNEIVDFEPTAENLANFLHEKIEAEVKHALHFSVTVWEAEKAAITYSKE